MHVLGTNYLVAIFVVELYSLIDNSIKTDAMFNPFGGQKEFASTLPLRMLKIIGAFSLSLQAF